MKTLTPRKILITGTSSGIGLAAARRLTERGHTVIGIARRLSPLEHPLYSHQQIDLSIPTASEKLNAIAKEHNDITAIISNAGGGQFGSLENFSPKQIGQSLQQNLLSHIYLVRAFIALLKQQSHGNIIVMGSEAALSGSRQGSLYCAAKFGLRGFVQSLREECSTRNVHVGIINPGMVRDEFFDQLHFEPGDDHNHALAVEDVVDAIELMLGSGSNAVVDEINLSPLTHNVRKK